MTLPISECSSGCKHPFLVFLLQCCFSRMSVLSDAIFRASFHITDLTIQPPAAGTIHHKFLSNILTLRSTLKRLCIDQRLFKAILPYYPAFGRLESLELDYWSNSYTGEDYDEFDFASKPRWEHLRELSGLCDKQYVNGYLCYLTWDNLYAR
jgi:hypothetical protein